MTDQTKHDIDHLHTKNKSRMHEIRKAEDAMSDAMESLSVIDLSLIHISEPTRLLSIAYSGVWL